MLTGLIVRPIHKEDYSGWRTLWDGYNKFYGRHGQTALDESITSQTWAWFFDESIAVSGFVAEYDGRVVGIAHFLFHPSTSRLSKVCYLQDLYTDDSYRGKGIGRALIQKVLDAAKTLGSSRVYWHTQTTNQAGRALYEKMAEYRDFIVYSREC